MDDGYHQPIESNSLGTLAPEEVLYAFRRCPHERRLDTGALLARYGDLHLALVYDATPLSPSLVRHKPWPR